MRLSKTNAQAEWAHAGNDWEISDVQSKCDLVTQDNALANSYAEHLLTGKSLPTNYNTYINQIQAVTGNGIAINVPRAATRLRSFYGNEESEQYHQR